MSESRRSGMRGAFAADTGASRLPASPGSDDVGGPFRRRLAVFFRDARVELTIALLILGSVILAFVEAALPLSHPWALRVSLLGDALTLSFVVELLLRLHASRRAREFFAEYWLDILAVMPLLRPLRFLRFLRLLRLFRAGVLIHRRSRRIFSGLAESGGEYALLAIFIGTSIVVGAVGILQLEGPTHRGFDTFEEAFWWSIFSMAAGEPIPSLPHTAGGRALTLFIMVAGMTVFAMFTGIVSAVMIQRLRRRMDEKELTLEELEQHIVICGWNRSGKLFLREVQRYFGEDSKPIVVVAELPDDDTIELEGLRTERVYVVRGDYTRVSVLEQAGIRRASAAVLLADKVVARSDQDRDARTVLAALTIEKLSPGVFSCVQLLNGENEPHLRMAGVEEVVVNDMLDASVLAVACLHRGVGQVVRELLTYQFGHNFFKCRVPDRWAGLELGALFEPLKRAANATILGLEAGGKIEVNPDISRTLAAGDSLVLVAEQEPDLDSLAGLKV